jgi:hypothetical protein
MDINSVMTAQEAAKLWKLKQSTVRNACLAGRFADGEFRKSAGTWLVTVGGMARLYGVMQ